MTSRRYSLAMLTLSFAVSGCSEATNEPAGVSVESTTSAVFNVEGAPTVAFSVPDMMCEESCVPTVRKTLAGQPGVKDVKVELATKTATVAVNQDEFDPEAAIAALVDLQFKKTKLATDEGEKAQN
jgi:copper chaperone CopZ